MRPSKLQAHELREYACTIIWDSSQIMGQKSVISDMTASWFIFAGEFGFFIKFVSLEWLCVICTNQAYIQAVNPGIGCNLGLFAQS